MKLRVLWTILAIALLSCGCQGEQGCQKPVSTAVIREAGFCQDVIDGQPEFLIESESEYLYCFVEQVNTGTAITIAANEETYAPISISHDQYIFWQLQESTDNVEYTISLSNGKSISLSKEDIK